MQRLARILAQATQKAHVAMRTLRVTTKENKTADGLSRKGGEKAGEELAKRLGVERVVHEIGTDDPMWDYIEIEAEPPSSPK